MNCRAAAKELRSLGCEEVSRRSTGSHRKWVNPAAGTGTVVPDWGSKELKMGTLRAAIRQLGLAWSSFEDA